LVAVDLTVTTLDESEEGDPLELAIGDASTVNDLFNYDDSLAQDFTKLARITQALSLVDLANSGWGCIRSL
jgi:hypothetical protein